MNVSKSIWITLAIYAIALTVFSFKRDSDRAIDGQVFSTKEATQQHEQSRCPESVKLRQIAGVLILVNTAEFANSK